MDREINKVEKVVIKKNPNGDTRTAKKDVTFDEFKEANNMHINDVKCVMQTLAKIIENRGNTHDYTKKFFEGIFYKDFMSALKNNTDFTKGDWYNMHVKMERHHLLSNCPDDVNLIDVLEMVVDCVCAGLTRSGEVRDLEINTEILEKALKNTTELIKNLVLVEHEMTGKIFFCKDQYVYELIVKDMMTDSDIVFINDDTEWDEKKYPEGWYIRNINNGIDNKDE